MTTGSKTKSGTDLSDGACFDEVQQPHLVLLIERARLLAGGSRHSLANIDRVTIGRGSARLVRRVMEDGRRTLQLSVPDDRMSSLHARIDRQGDSWVLVDCGSTNGSRVNRVRHSTTGLADGDLLEFGRTILRYRAAVRTPVTSEGDVQSEELAPLQKAFGTLVPTLRRELDVLERVAGSRTPLLLAGETGTGKEVLARAVHERSGRSGPFVAVNCGALPSALVESLLFGHKKGAFSGAVQDEPGFFRAADGGTLFLDEVGDMPKGSQAALLRVLQDQHVTPVGTTRPIEVDVRVIAATHLPLRELVIRGEFRQDLYARLSGFSFALPPLRERIDDIGVLVAAILRRFVPRDHATPTVRASTAYTILAHSWPNNVRELEQRLNVGAILVDNGRIEIAGLESEAGNLDPARAGYVPPLLSEDERALFDRVVASLAQHQGNVTRVGQAMGKARTQVHRWIRRFGIDVSRFRQSGGGDE